MPECYELEHSPANIIAILLVDLGIGNSVSSNVFPVFVGSEPDTPDRIITVFDTTQVTFGVIQMTGETKEHHGIQIRIRAPSYPAGWAKASEIRNKLDTQVERVLVTIDDAVYLVHSTHRESGPFHLGKEKPESKRDIITLNYTCPITRHS